jgi:hypothetical protein
VTEAPPTKPVMSMVIDEDSRDDLGGPSHNQAAEDDEVIQAPQGRSGPDPVTQKLIRVMDDGSVDTGPIPPEMLREALGLPPLDTSDQSSTAWLRDAVQTDEDDDDDDDEDGAVDDTTTMRPILPSSPAPMMMREGSTREGALAATPTSPAPPPTMLSGALSGAPVQPPPLGQPPVLEAVPTVIVSAEFSAQAPKSVFGFPGEVQDDDVSKLQSEPVKLGRGVTAGASLPPGKAPSLPPTRMSTPPPSTTPMSPPRAPSLPPTSVGHASLEFMSGPDRGKRIDVGETITVGQSRQCGVSIPGDVRLSAVHCKVEKTREGFVLTDQGSANGTVVNGQRVSRFALNGGEVIMVGRTVLRFRLEGV